MAGLRSRKPRRARRHSSVDVVVVDVWPAKFVGRHPPGISVVVVVDVWPAKVVVVLVVVWPAKVVVVGPVELVLELVVVVVVVLVVGVQSSSAV
jgi:hypothetical protein